MFCFFVCVQLGLFNWVRSCCSQIKWRLRLIELLWLHNGHWRSCSMLFQWDGINSSFIGVNSVNMRGEKLVPGHNFEEFFLYKTRKKWQGDSRSSPWSQGRYYLMQKWERLKQDYRFDLAERIIVTEEVGADCLSLYKTVRRIGSG